jgi:hypothetical protein
VQALDAGAGLADAIAERSRPARPEQPERSPELPIALASEDHAGEQVALAAPLRVDGGEGFALDLGADRPIGRVLPPGAEEPRVGLLAGVGAGRDHLRA